MPCSAANEASEFLLLFPLSGTVFVEVCRSMFRTRFLCCGIPRQGAAGSREPSRKNLEFLLFSMLLRMYMSKLGQDSVLCSGMP